MSLAHVLETVFKISFWKMRLAVLFIQKGLANLRVIAHVMLALILAIFARNMSSTIWERRRIFLQAKRRGNLIDAIIDCNVTSTV